MIDEAAKQASTQSIFSPVMSRKSTFWALLIASAALLSRPQEAFAQTESSGCDRAGELLTEGETHFNSGAFDEAAKLLERALTLCRRPVLFYNLGRAYEGLGDLDKAIAAYRSYLRESPGAEDRGGIEQRIATMERELALRDVEPSPTLASPTASTPTIVPWIVAGTGAATLGVAVALAAVALGHESDADESENHRMGSDSLERAETFAIAANVTFVVGGVLAAAGITWGIVDVATPDEAIALRLTLGVANLQLGATF